MRLIDADALIEDIRKHSESYFADDFAHEWVDKQPTIIPDRKTEQWIPVSERLPEEVGFYLATLDGEICGEDKPFCGLAEFEKGKWIDDEEDYQCIIAWMPLPEPYQESEG